MSAHTRDPTTTTSTSASAALRCVSTDSSPTSTSRSPQYSPAGSPTSFRNPRSPVGSPVCRDRETHLVSPRTPVSGAVSPRSYRAESVEEGSVEYQEMEMFDRIISSCFESQTEGATSSTDLWQAQHSLRSSYGRRKFTSLLSQRRVKSKQLSDSGFDVLAALMETAILETHSCGDLEVFLALVVLSSTFYRCKQAHRREFLHRRMQHLSVWKDVKFWEQVFEDSLYLERCKAGVDILQANTSNHARWKAMSEEEKLEMRQKEDLVVFSQLGNFLFHMLQCGVSAEQCQTFMARVAQRTGLHEQQYSDLQSHLPTMAEQSYYRRNSVESCNEGATSNVSCTNSWRPQSVFLSSVTRVTRFISSTKALCGKLLYLSVHSQHTDRIVNDLRWRVNVFLESADGDIVPVSGAKLTASTEPPPTHLPAPPTSSSPSSHTHLFLHSAAISVPIFSNWRTLYLQLCAAKPSVGSAVASTPLEDGLSRSCGSQFSNFSENSSYLDDQASVTTTGSSGGGGGGGSGSSLPPRVLLFLPIKMEVLFRDWHRAPGVLAGFEFVTCDRLPTDTGNDAVRRGSGADTCVLGVPDHMASSGVPRVPPFLPPSSDDGACSRTCLRFDPSLQTVSVTLAVPLLWLLPLLMEETEDEN